MDADHREARKIVLQLHAFKSVICPVCQSVIHKSNFVHFDARADVPLGVECPIVVLMKRQSHLPFKWEKEDA